MPQLLKKLKRWNYIVNIMIQTFRRSNFTYSLKSDE